MFGTLGAPELVVVTIMVALFVLGVAFPAGRICRRLGFSPLLGLLAIVPVANVGLLLYIAFSKWPALTTDSASGKS